MNKINGLFMMMFLLVGTLGLVVAEESDNSTIPEVEDEEDEAPEAKRVGWFEDRMDRIMMSFTFDKEKKIERALIMAEKRLVEAEVLAEEDPEAYARVQERYTELVARAEEILAGIESNGDENDSVEYMEKIVRIQDKFERHRDHADEIYTRALERFAANNASDEKIERFEMFHERALNKSYRMEERAIEKRDNAIRKHKALSEVNDDDLDELLADIERRENLTANREARAERAEDRVQRVVEYKQRYVERVRLRLDDSSLTEEQRLRIEVRLEGAEGNIERFEVRSRERFEDGERRFDIRFRERNDFDSDDDSDDDEDDSDDDDSDDETNSTN